MQLTPFCFPQHIHVSSVTLNPKNLDIWLNFADTLSHLLDYEGVSYFWLKRRQVRDRANRMAAT